MSAVAPTQPPAVTGVTGAAARPARRVPGMVTLTFCIAGGLTIVIAEACHSATLDYNPNASWAPAILYASVLCFWWAAVFLLQQAIGRRWPSFWQISFKTIVLQLLGSKALALFHLEVLTLSARYMVLHWRYLYIEYGHNSYFNLHRFGIENLLYALIWIAGAALHSQIARQKDALETAQLKQQLSSAHLRALQMQMEPHFLFNTLNAITTLVELGRQEEAIETLSHLNAILKSTLAREAPEKVTLAQELAVVENYLAIEQIRFADRLKVTMSVDPAALNSMVPCFLLQPIVENAIRHGISRKEDSGVIQTLIERDGNNLHLTVRDNGPGPQAQHATNGHGIGLRNIQDRLSHFYPGNYSFHSGASKTGGFEVAITIPYEGQPA